MLVLIWVLLSVMTCMGNHGGATSAPACDEKQYTLTLSERNITAEAGLCVLLPCSFTSEPNSGPKITSTQITCHKSNKACEKPIFNSSDTKNTESKFRGRVSLLEHEEMKSCSIIINDLTESDSGSYTPCFICFQQEKCCRTTSGETVTVTVTGLSQKPTVLIPPLTAGQQTTLTCTAPGLCSGSVPNITWSWRGKGQSDSYITENITEFKTESVTAGTQRHISTLTFNLSAEHHGTEITCKVSFKGGITTEETQTVNVSYVNELKISGNTTMKEGDALNLTCSVDSFPASVIKWTKSGSDKILPEQQGSASLIVSHMSAQHSGEYICTAKHQNKTLTKPINVTFFPRILTGPVCELQSDVLTCVCVSEGFPLPSIKWPLLENHTQYSVITTVSKHTVNSTVILTVKDNSTVVECVSSNEAGEVKKQLNSQPAHLLTKLLKIVKEAEPTTIIVFLTGFVMGIFVMTIITCLVIKCHRKKQKSSLNLVDTLEMVTTQTAPLLEDDEQAEVDVTHDQEAAAEGEAGNGNVGSTEVEYSDINFSAIKKKNPTEGEETTATTETEYAEIKKEGIQERQYADGEDDEVLEGGEKEDGMIEVETEMRDCVPAEEERGGEEVAVYSNVKEMMDEI